jgi:hypothetical protein
LKIHVIGVSLTDKGHSSVGSFATHGYSHATLRVVPRGNFEIASCKYVIAIWKSVIAIGKVEITVGKNPLKSAFENPRHPCSKIRLQTTD